MASEQKNAILVCCDHRDAWQAAFVLSQARAAVKNRANVVIYCFVDRALSDDLTALIKAQATLIRCEDVFDLDEFVPDGEDGAAHPMRMAFLRLFALETLTRIHNRVLHLSAECFIETDHLDAIFDLPMQHPLAAVQHRTFWPTPPEASAVKFLSTYLTEMPARYFDLAVAMVDAKPFGAGEIGQKAIAWLRAQSPAPLSAEVALNIELQAAWDNLSPRWNWPMTESLAMIGAMRPRAIVQFCGLRKAWSDNVHFFDAHYRETILHFLTQSGRNHEAQRIIEQGYQTHRERRRLRLLEGWISGLTAQYDRIAPYLAREDFVDSPLMLRPESRA